MLEIGIETDEKAIQKFNQTSANTVAVLKKVAIAGAAAATAMVAYTVKMGKATDSNIKFARSSGIAFQTLQELEFAAQREGAAVGEMTSSLVSLNNQLGQLAIGRGPLEAVRRLGLSIRDGNGELLTADKLLIQIGENIQGLPRQRQAELVSQFGISQNVLQLLQQGRFSIEELRKEARKLGLENVELARKAEKLNDQFVNAKTKLNAALIPMRIMITELALKLIPKIVEWIEKNKELIPQLTKLAVVVAGIFVAAKVVSWTAAVIKATQAVFGLAGAMGALGAAKGIAGGAGAAGGLVSGGGAAAALGIKVGSGAAAGGGALAASGPILALLAAVVGTAAFVKIMERKAGITVGPGRGAEFFKKVDRRPLSEKMGQTNTMTFNITESNNAQQTASAVSKAVTNMLRAELPNAEPQLV